MQTIFYKQSTNLQTTANSEFLIGLILQEKNLHHSKIYYWMLTNIVIIKLALLLYMILGSACYNTVSVLLRCQVVKALVHSLHDILSVANRWDHRRIDLRMWIIIQR